MRYILLLLVLNSSLNYLNSQNLQIVDDRGYGFDDIDIMLNNYNILTPYNQSAFRSKVGGNFTKFTDTTADLLLEFGYNEYAYEYGQSSVIINDKWGVSDIQIEDGNLAINGIMIGDSIEKAKSVFSRYRVKSNAIIIEYGGRGFLRFEYNSSGKITYIAYLVRT